MGRPLSGKSAPKGRMSLIDRVAGGSYTPPAPQPLAMPRQLESVSAPVKNNEVKPAPKAVAEPKKTTEPKAVAEPKKTTSEADEVAELKKKRESERAERDIKAYAAKKAQKAAAAKMAAKKK